MIVSGIGVGELVKINLSSGSTAAFSTKIPFLSSIMTGWLRSFDSTYFQGSLGFSRGEAFGKSPEDGMSLAEVLFGFRWLYKGHLGSLALWPHCPHL